MRQPHGWHAHVGIEAAMAADLYRRRRQRAHLPPRRPAFPPCTGFAWCKTSAPLSPRAGPYCLRPTHAFPSAIGSGRLTLPALSAWLAYILTHCGNGPGAAYTVLSMRRRAEPSSLGPAKSRHGFEPNLLPRPYPTANGVSSSLVRLPHFHKAPSSDGASFFPKRFDLPDCKDRHPCK